MASLKDVDQVADDLERLVGDLRSELKNGPDFERLAQIADEISEHADNAAQTFTSVNSALMSRIEELVGRGKSDSGRKASPASQAREKASSS